LRCSSSILNALSNGAEEVIPVKTLSEAYQLHSEHPVFILAGERRGLKPRRFNLGNSPLEFTRRKVHGKTVILTTTSGTTALTCSKAAEWVLIGGFLNAESVAVKAIEIGEREEIDISLVLSGRKKHFSLEDFVCGGAIAEKIREKKGELSDASFAAFLAFKQMEKSLGETIMMGEHAKHLINLGLKRDIEFSCQLNRFTIIPRYKKGVIRLLKNRCKGPQPAKK
jgi:2-phosphosulfolactate phosphatase